MLLGFKRQFAPFVEDHSKTHTIRGIRKIPPRVGEICHCYVDPRQKTMRLLGRWPCVRIEEIVIEGIWLKHGDVFRGSIHLAGNRLDENERDLLAWRDGFRHESLNEREGLGYGGCFTLMMEFWRERLPFVGQIIHWNPETRI
jgi:hypothetical protein